jgi:hypothetical protein
MLLATNPGYFFVAHLVPERLTTCLLRSHDGVSSVCDRESRMSVSSKEMTVLLLEFVKCVWTKSQQEMLYLSYRWGVEGVARGLEGVHLADTCILTKLE